MPAPKILKHLCQKALKPFGLGIAKDLVRRSLLGDNAVIKENDPV